MAAKQQGPIHNHMTNTHNPLIDLPPTIWDTPDLSTFSTKERFDEHYQGFDRRLILKTGQSTVYALEPPARSNKQSSIVKCYDLSTTDINQIWQEVVLVKNAKLLAYDDVYYDKDKNMILITSEPLKYTLGEYIENERPKKNKHTQI